MANKKQAEREIERKREESVVKPSRSASPLITLRIRESGTCAWHGGTKGVELPLSRKSKGLVLDFSNFPRGGKWKRGTIGGGGENDWRFIYILIEIRRKSL